jgi:hypothetical protein
MDNNGRGIVRQAQSLFSARQRLDLFWDELARQFYPEMADFVTDHELGDDFASHLSDASPMLARRELGESLGSMLRPSGQPWFECVVEGEPPPKAGSMEALWLEFQTERTRNTLYGRSSQFVRAMKTADHTYATFGNTVTSVTEGMSPRDILFKTWHLRDCVWTDDMLGDASCLYRKAKPTLSQLVQMFGEKALTPDLRTALSHDPQRRVDVLHVCMPASSYERLQRPDGGRRWDWVSIWVLRDGEHVLRHRYVPEKIYTVSRWHRPSESQYGVSPAAIAALPNARMVQRMASTVISAAEKSVDPPVVAKGERVKTGVDLSAGSIIWIDPDYDERSGEALRPLDLGKNVKLGMEMQVDVRNQIDRAFYLNKLQLPAAQAKTAYETARLVEQYVRDALPLFETMETEYLDPILDAGVSFMLRVGAYGPLDEIPPGLRGKQIGFQFNNPLRQALKQQTVKSFNDMAGLLSIAAQVDPAAADNVDIDVGLRDALSASGSSDAWVRPSEEVDALRQQRAQMQAQAAAAQQGQPAPQDQTEAAPSPLDDMMAGQDAMGGIAA